MLFLLVVLSLAGYYWRRRQKFLELLLWEKIECCIRETAEGSLFRDTQFIMNLLVNRQYRKIKQLKEAEPRWSQAAEHLRNIIFTAHLNIKRDQRIKFFHLGQW
jgi:hypothetical protein